MDHIYDGLTDTQRVEMRKLELFSQRMSAEDLRKNLLEMTALHFRHKNLTVELLKKDVSGWSVVKSEAKP